MKCHGVRTSNGERLQSFPPPSVALRSCVSVGGLVIVAADDAVTAAVAAGGVGVGATLFFLTRLPPGLGDETSSRTIRFPV